MAKKKKINGLSMAIVALNIVIVGIIILLIVLIYLHMKEDTVNDRADATVTTTAKTEPSDTVNEETQITTTLTDITDAPVTSPSDTSDVVSLPVTYNKEYFSNDLFIGDSISTGFYLYQYLDIKNVFAEVGLNPESALNKEIDGVTCIEKASAMQPRNIYIMLGTNGLAFLDSSYMTSKMLELIEALEMACPTAKICIVSIPPVTKAHESEGKETMDKVNKYNSELKSKVTPGGYTFIDISSMLKDKDGYFDVKYAEEDGLHFLGNTYIAVLGYIEKTLN